VYFRFTAVVALVAAAAVSACGPDPDAPVVLALESPSLATVSGLSRHEMSALDANVLPRVFRVQVRGAGVSIAGSYAVSGGQVRFTPAYPFDKGREYSLELLLDEIPGHRGAARSHERPPSRRTSAAPRRVSCPSIRRRRCGRRTC
jgi:hypothetical protein